jgi:hypothetical protein
LRGEHFDWSVPNEAPDSDEQYIPTIDELRKLTTEELAEKLNPEPIITVHGTVQMADDWPHSHTYYRHGVYHPTVAEAIDVGLKEKEHLLN